jgi:inhibitor of cysteine peptidase
MLPFVVLLVAVFVVAACGGAAEPTLDPPPDEGAMIRDVIMINSADVLVMESFPVQVSVALAGDLPTPCHFFRAAVSAPNADNEIHLDVYSEIPLGNTCIAVLEPFEESVSLDLEGLADGDYTVWVNGEQVGEFSYPG